jgi:hypothetical protein
MALVIPTGPNPFQISAIYGELKDYYDNDALACFIAPLYPDMARNNLWVCRK